MRFEYLTLLILFPLLVSCLFQTKDVIRTRPIIGKKGEPIQEFHLDNGMRVLLQEDHTLPVASLHIFYKGGSANEIAGKRGIAHMFEHMMFKGSKNFGPEEHARLIVEAGGRINAFTTEDYTGYFETIPSDALELALRLESDRMQFLDLSEKTVDSEREVVKEEKRARIDNQPISRLFEKFREVAFKGHPYSWTPAGKLEDLDTITPEDCMAFYKKFYAPGNALMVVTGDVRAENLLALVKRYFGTIKEEEGEISEVPDVPAIKGERREVIETAVQLPMTMGGFSIPPTRHHDIPVLELITKVLSDGESSWLHRELVREKEIAVAAGAFLSSMKRGGTFMFYALYFPKFPHTLIEEELLAQFERLKEKGPTVKEFQKAKNQLISHFMMELSGVEGRASLIGYCDIMLGDFREFLRIEERYRNISLRDCFDVAGRYFIKENLTLMSLKPEGGTVDEQGGGRGGER